MNFIEGLGGTPYKAATTQNNKISTDRNSFALLFAEMMSQQMDRALFTGMGASNGEEGGFNNASMLSMLLQMAGSGIQGLTGGNGVSSCMTCGNASAAGSTGQGAAEAALTRLGDPYSQAKRGTGNYVDCSSLTQWAYRNTGVSLPATAAEQAKFCQQNGYTIPKQELQKGDLVFWQKTGCNCGRYDEIHHVGIYLGNGKVVEASSSKGQVVVSDMWGENGGKWQTAFYARPY